MKTPPMTRVQSRAVVSGGFYGPEGLTAFLPTMTLGLTERFFANLFDVSHPLNLRGGLIPAPSFKAATSKIVNFGRVITHWRGGVFLLPEMPSAFFIQICKQFFHNCFQRLHKFHSFFADHYSEEGSRDVGQVDQTKKSGAQHA